MSVRVYSFHQEGCMGCEEQKPINQEVSKALGIEIKEIDIIQHMVYIKKYQLKVTPTIVILVNGDEKARFEGVVHREELEAAIQKRLGTGS